MKTNTLICRDEQEGFRATPTPSQKAAWARRLEVIRQKPAPQPKLVPPLFDVAAWRRRSRGVQAQEVLHAIPTTYTLAVALGVTDRTIAYWRRGEHAPTPRHWQQLAALHLLLIIHRT